MSKIGRKPVPFSTAKVEIAGNKVTIKGSKVSFEHELPEGLTAKIEDGSILLSPVENTRQVRALWGLHRALLFNKVVGAEKGFEQAVKIVGLGYKMQLAGKTMTFSLGYSHKITYDLPDGVTVEVDKRTGQQLLFKSHDKELLGAVCDKVKSFKRTEPYKGTGIMRAEERIIRKAGKTGA